MDPGQPSRAISIAPPKLAVVRCACIMPAQMGERRFASLCLPLVKV